ncbi:MAG: type I-E CRISPR-associated protein Cas7/Cse4/CasC, partial [Anaerolineae bacterium]|nr:type I-E CRISPR-associated protein Cas7/Cse4/CasC [Anaerolineae bacterium]
MLVELHILQSFSPSNLNRDDTNNPKDCEFGGVRRARISSQCLKRAIRTSPEFARATQVDGGMRSRRIMGERLQPTLEQAGKPAEEVAKVLAAFVPAYLSKLDKDGERTSVLLYLSGDELQAIAEGLLAHWDDLLASNEATLKELVKELTRRFRSHTSAPDIALFGRMLAERPELNLDAACQVAHAISTHRVTMEMDWWTAVDDLQPEDTAGAGMMGFSAFDSACFYRYACIHWPQLLATLGDGDLARRTVEAFLRASIAAVPSGKQNSYAAYNAPSLALGVVRRDGLAWSLANAFERPVLPDREGGYVRPSARALDAYWARLCRAYGDAALAAVGVLAVDDGLELPNL